MYFLLWTPSPECFEECSSSTSLLLPLSAVAVPMALCNFFSVFVCCDRPCLLGVPHPPVQPTAVFSVLHNGCILLFLFPCPAPTEHPFPIPLHHHHCCRLPPLWTWIPLSVHSPKHPTVSSPLKIKAFPSAMLFNTTRLKVQWAIFGFT